MTSEAGYFWSAAEEEALGPYVRALGRGKYESAFAAARAYLAEASRRSLPVRSLRAVEKHVIDEARRQGLTWGDSGWSASELRVLRRYARALAQGRYRYQREAVTACVEEIELQCRRRRTLVVVEVRLRALLRDQGVVWGGSRLFAAERRSVARHARALVRGKFPDALRAAEACLAEIRRLPDDERPIRPRSLHTIHCSILKQAHGLRRPWVRSRWGREEDEIARRYGAGLARGEFADSLEAVAACRRELRRSPARVRPLNGIKARVIRWAHRNGWVRSNIPWNDREYAVLDMYVRALHEGRYARVRSAAKDCAVELKALHHREAKQLSERYGRTRPRTQYAVAREIDVRARSLGLPRPHATWTKAETEIVLKYARAVDSGAVPSWRKAARICLTDLDGLYSVAGRGSPIHVRRLAGRGFIPVHNKMIAVAHKHGLRGPVKPLPWSPAESKVFDQWLRWYDRYRSAGRRRRSVLSTASTGLHEELEEKGFTRTAGACRERLKNGWLEMYGLA
jgi:hypothetical protein